MTTAAMTAAVGIERSLKIKLGDFGGLPTLTSADADTEEAATEEQ